MSQYKWHAKLLWMNKFAIAYARDTRGGKHECFVGKGLAIKAGGAKAECDLVGHLF